MYCFQAPDDYDGSAFDVTFPLNITYMDVPISIVNDDIHEDTERFNLSLSTNDPNVSLGPDSAVEITDNDRKFAEHIWDTDHK